jgi:hypothetical protein
MFVLASTADGELLGTIHAIYGMCFIRSGEGRITYSTTMNNAKHDNRVNRVQQDNLQHNNAKHNNEQCQFQEVLIVRGAELSADVGELEGLDGNTTMPVLDEVEGRTTVPVLDGIRCKHIYNF